LSRFEALAFPVTVFVVGIKDLQCAGTHVHDKRSLFMMLFVKYGSDGILDMADVEVVAEHMNRLMCRASAALLFVYTH
jgi:hypothetical protein